MRRQSTYTGYISLGIGETCVDQLSDSSEEEDQESDYEDFENSSHVDSSYNKMFQK